MSRELRDISMGRELRDVSMGRSLRDVSMGRELRDVSMGRERERRSVCRSAIRSELRSCFTFCCWIESCIALAKDHTSVFPPRIVDCDGAGAAQPDWSTMVREQPIKLAEQSPARPSTTPTPHTDDRARCDLMSTHPRIRTYYWLMIKGKRKSTGPSDSQNRFAL